MLCADLIYDCLLAHSHFPTVHNLLPYPVFTRAWYRRHKWDELEKMMEQVMNMRIFHAKVVLPELNVVTTEGNGFIYSEDPRWTELWTQFERWLQSLAPPCQLFYIRVDGIICLFGSGFEGCPELASGPCVLSLEGVTRKNTLIFRFQDGLDAGRF